MEARLIDGETVTIDDIYDKHHKFAWKIARKFQKAGVKAGVTTEDIHQIASIGMVKAFNKFDESKGFKFITYAAYLMEGEIKRYLREQRNMVHYPRRTVELASRIFRENMVDDSNNEIAEILGIEESEVADARIYMKDHQSTEKAVYESDGVPITLGDMMGDEEDYTGAHVNEFIEYLPYKLQETAKGLMNGKTQTEIAGTIGVSQVQVSRLQRKLKEAYEKFERGDSMVAQGDLNKAKELLESTSMTYQAIADETGVGVGTVGYHGRKIRKEESKPSQKPVRKREKPPESKDTNKHNKVLHDDVLKKYNELSEQHNKTLEENNRLHKQLSNQQLEIEDLTNKVATLKMTVRTAEEMISSKNEQLRDRNTDCDRLEEEISKLYEAYEMLKKWTRADMEVERTSVYERRSAAV